MFPLSSGEKLTNLKIRLQQAMAVKRQEDRERKAALYRLDNEDCGEEEEEEEMTDSEGEEVRVDGLRSHSTVRVLSVDFSWWCSKMGTVTFKTKTLKCFT